MPHHHGPGPRGGGAAQGVVLATKRINCECAERGDVRGARALLETLILGKGMWPTLVTGNVMLKAYRTARDPEGAEALLLEFRGWGLAPDGCTYSTLVDAYGLAGRVADAYRMATAAEAAGAEKAQRASSSPSGSPLPF